MISFINCLVKGIIKKKSKISSIEFKKKDFEKFWGLKGRRWGKCD